jgi:hypothetical protein
MWQLLGFTIFGAFLLTVLISLISTSIVAALPFIFFKLVLPYISITLLYIYIRKIYHAFIPGAKLAHLESMAKALEEAKNNREIRKRQKQEKVDSDEKRKEEEFEAQLNKEIEHELHRDGDQQTSPYTYEIGQHGNEALAIRYGIANHERKVKEYFYYAKGGERIRNPDRDKIFYEPADTIRLQKIKKIDKNIYEVFLTDFRDRKAKAVIEVGTEYVKTLLPLNDSWFEKNADLEIALKGNNSFSLKELATFHVQKTVGT